MANEFTTIMKNHSNENLLEVLKNRDKFQDEAKSAAVLESVLRGLITDENDLNEKYPLYVQPKEIKEEVSDIEFKEFEDKTLKIFILIVVSLGLIFFNRLPLKDENVFAYWMPVALSIITVYCYNSYSRLLAKIVIWFAAILLVITSIGLVTTIFYHIT